MNRWFSFPLGLVFCCLGTALNAQPISVENPTAFFTNVADRLLSSELGMSLNRIQLFPTNQYTPAVHRLLQVAANMYDAATNRSPTDYPFLPTVFRPLFTNQQGTIYICGYAEETGTNILTAPLRDLASPDDRQALQATDMVRGIPAIIGARKGFPAFNELGMQTQVSVTRRLQFLRASSSGPITETNQMYLLAISNSFGMEAWNSYQTAFPRDLLMLASADLTAMLTNEFGNVLLSNRVSLSASPRLIGSNTWPGFPGVNQNSKYSFLCPFLPVTNTFPLFAKSAYSQFQRGFVSDTSVFESPSGFPIPHWWLNIKVQAQFALVDTTINPPRIVDYVNLGSTDSPLDITELLQRNDPSVPPSCALFPNPVERNQMWCTNKNSNEDLTPSWGVLNQLALGLGQLQPPGLNFSGYDQMPNSGAPGSLMCQINFFRTQFGLFPIPSLGGLLPCPGYEFSITNTFYAPFVPRIDIYSYTQWKVNDPLIHYTVSDLTDPTLKRIHLNETNNSPLANIGFVNDRYRPWGFQNPAGNDPNRYTNAIKDPLVTGSDSWSFPTNGLPALDWLGQVHRGTPWQTLYLKSSGIAQQTWTNWTGDIQSGPNGEASDGALMLPTNDWRMTSLLIKLLRTNALSSLQSANQPNTIAWEQVLHGTVVLSNTAPAQFETLVMFSNSPQANVIASALDAARAAQPGGYFLNTGDLLMTPELSMASPWLNQSSGPSTRISDEAFEEIPSQLLLRLRPDSIGTIAKSGLGISVQFNGEDGRAYAIQTSPDLLTWTSVSTNIATNGGFGHVDPGNSRVGRKFFRSVLLP